VRFEGATDAGGRVELRGPAGRDLGVCILGPGHVPVRQAGVRLDRDDEFVVRVRRGARLIGRVVPPEAVDELKRLAQGEPGKPFPAEYRPRLELTRGTERFPSTYSGGADTKDLFLLDDGSFAAAGLPSGSWTVMVRGWLLEGPGGTDHCFPAATVALVDGDTVQQDLDLRCILSGTVEGLVLLNGAPLARGTVTLHGGDRWFNVRTDADGRFTHRCFAGEYGFLIQHPDGAGSSAMLHCPSRVLVVHGETTRQTFAVAAGKLRITVRDADGKPVAGIQVQVHGSVAEDRWLPPTDADARTDGELTAESVMLRVLPKSLRSPEAQTKFFQQAAAAAGGDPFAGHWIELGQVAIQPGQTHELELRLPAR
jgi:hypothetical protein